MKILLSFLQDNTVIPHPVPAYRFWSYSIKNGIEEAGMRWAEVPGADWAAGLVPYENDPALQKWKNEIWESTLSYIRANRQHIDIFLCYLYPKQISVQVIKDIKAMGIPCVNFYCDNVRSFTKLPPEFEVFDLVWVPEVEALPLYQTAGLAHINLPMPIWVDAKYRRPPEQTTNAISFIGSKDHLRAQLLAEAISKGLEIQIRGSGWNTTHEQPLNPTNSNILTKIRNQINLLRHSGAQGFAAYHLNRYQKISPANVPPVNIFEAPGFEEYISLSRESNITLGINRVPAFNTLSGNIMTYSRLRDLEAPMLGACYLTEYTEGLPHLYKIGAEIETYRSADELVYKCRELINSKSKQKELRVKGQQRALNAHSIPVSLQKIKARLFN
jgi:hypothetical protein